MELKKIKFIHRLLRQCASLDITVYLFLCLIILFTLVVKWLFLVTMYVFILQIVVARKYIYEITIINGTVHISYLLFNKERKIQLKNENVSILEYGHGKEISPSFTIVFKNKNSCKQIIRQYKIGEWEKQANIEKLKALLNTSE